MFETTVEMQYLRILLENCNEQKDDYFLNSRRTHCIKLVNVYQSCRPRFAQNQRYYWGSVRGFTEYLRTCFPSPQAPLKQPAHLTAPSGFSKATRSPDVQSHFRHISQ